MKNTNPPNLKKDALYVYTGYVLRYLSLIILIPYYSRVLGPENYGQLLTAMSLMGIIWMVVNYGFSPIGARTIAKTKNQQEINESFTRQILGRLFLLPVGILIGFLGTIFSPILSTSPMFGVLATFFGILCAFNLGWFFQGMRQFKRNMFVESLAYPLTLGLALTLVKGENDGVFALTSLSISGMICFSLAYFLAFQNVSFCRQTIWDVFAEIKESSILFLQNVNTQIMTTGSVFLLSFLVVTQQVGYFGAAERIMSFGIAFLLPAAQYLMPTISNKMESDPDSVPRLVRIGLSFELIYGFCAMVGGLMLAPYVLPFMLGESFIPSVVPFQILICAMPFAAFTHACANYILIPLKKEKWSLYAILIGNCINIIVAIFAASLWGAIGMAVARTLGEIVIAMAMFVFIWRLNLFSTFLNKKHIVDKKPL